MTTGSDRVGTTPALPFRVLARYPHDREAFTQGLALHDGVLYESTGLYGQSQVRIVDMSSGRVVRSTTLPANYFGEGLAAIDDHLLQLTWQSRTGFVYDRHSLRQIDSFTYPTEGWGLTRHGRQLLMSDGTPTLYTLDPATLRQEAVLQVTENGRPLPGLNDLQTVDGLLFANVYLTDRIVGIDLDSGRVVGSLQLTGLNQDPSLRARKLLTEAAVLNGIAHDETTGRLYVTGKLWDSVYHLELGAQDRP